MAEWLERWASAPGAPGSNPCVAIFFYFIPINSETIELIKNY